MWLLPFLFSIAFAEEQRPVRAGETIESIANDLGDPNLAEVIRTLNAFTADQQPEVGYLIRLPAPDGTSAEQNAFLTSLRGGAIIRHKDGTEDEAKVFTPIPAGETICTSSTGVATLRLATQCSADGTSSDDILLYEDTCVRVENAFASETRRSTVITVSSGSIAVAENTAEGNVTVLTPSGLTSGEDGGYRVTVEGTAMRTEAIGGDVSVTGMGEEVAVKEGQGSRTKTGEKPGAPIDLLPPGNPETPSDGASLRRPLFRWSNVEGALGYRLEIAANAAFTDLVFQQEVKQSELATGLLTLPNWNVKSLYWRVTSLDEFGFLGIPSEPRLLRFPEGIQ